MTTPTSVILLDTQTLQTLIKQNEELLKEVKELRAEVRNQKLDGFMTKREAMEFLKVSKTTFEKYLYLDKVKLPHRKLGGSLLFKREELEKYADSYTALSELT